MNRPDTLAQRDYLSVHAVLLLGYAVLGKAFAYLGVAPFYAGELALILGTCWFGFSARRWLALDDWHVAPLMLFMIWGAARSLPGVQEYGIIALRDAVIWGYGWFAVLVYVCLATRPARLIAMQERYAFFARYGPILMGLMWMLSTVFEVITVAPAGVRVPVLKGGECAVHAAGIFAFVYLRVRPIHSFWLVGPAALSMMGLNTRAGILSVTTSAGLLLLIRPNRRKVATVLGAFLLVIVLVGVSDVSFSMPGSTREISLDGLASGLRSIVQDSGRESYDGTKRWRLLWWRKIYAYTVEGEYFWTGKGFGVNLADDDGFSLEASHALRSPHNGHLTLLARGGVPGFALWLLVQLTWGAGMLRTYFRAARARDHGWARMCLFLLAYWTAFMVNASFDVFMEGPMGGIWFWTIYGAGLAVMRIYGRTKAGQARRIQATAAMVRENEVPAGCLARS